MVSVPAVALAKVRTPPALPLPILIVAALMVLIRSQGEVAGSAAIVIAGIAVWGGSTVANDDEGRGNRIVGGDKLAVGPSAEADLELAGPGRSGVVDEVRNVGEIEQADHVAGSNAATVTAKVQICVVCGAHIHGGVRAIGVEHERSVGTAAGGKVKLRSSEPVSVNVAVLSVTVLTPERVEVIPPTVVLAFRVRLPSSGVGGSGNGVVGGSEVTGGGDEEGFR